MTPPLAKVEDSTLIDLALAGQAEGFTILMDRHLAAVKRRVGSIVRNASDADDVVQEVLFKVWRRLATFRSESSFRTWMTRIAINEALTSYRRNSRSRICQPLHDLDTFASPGELPDQSLIRTGVTQSVRGAVRGLPRKYRQVLILRDLEQLSARETAQRLGSTIPTVKTRLFRARLMLSSVLQEPKTRRLLRAA